MYKFCPLIKLLLNQSGEQRICFIDSTLHYRILPKNLDNPSRKGYLSFYLNL